MTKAIEYIVAGYSTLKDRKALEAIRDHRRRMLMANRLSAASSGFNLDRIMTDILDEIDVVEAALSKLPDGGSTPLN